MASTENTGDIHYHTDNLLLLSTKNPQDIVIESLSQTLGRQDISWREILS